MFAISYNNGSVTKIRYSSDDYDEKGSPIAPELEVIYAVNARAMSIQQLYKGLQMPSGECNPLAVFCRTAEK